ncbi:MAG TPA: sigma 54-interacting transcriptional regulator, partial [Chitinophagaceae bacterium]|nr:sigma 54-interacting transcriptional regulator [Chitinophagaceae bacterium]
VYITANFDSEILEAAKATQPYGYLIKPFRENDVLVTLEIALFRHEFSLESNYHKLETIQKQLNSLLLKDNSGIDLLLELGKILQPHIPFDFLMISTVSPGIGQKIIGCYLRVGYHEYQRMDIKEWLVVTGLNESAIRDLLKTMPVVSEGRFYNGEMFGKEEQSSGLIKIIGTVFQMQSQCCIPVFLYHDMPIQVSFFSRRPENYASMHLDLLNNLRSALQIYFQKSLPINMEESKEFPVTKNSSSRIFNGNEAIDFSGIIGKSSGLLNVFDSIMQVAPFDTSVLLLGESGTGKERVAHCIQELSSRKGMPFIKVNCAVLPPSLIESELFGHEKGAFTGAAETHKGHFEEAMNGTIFLDEIGEVPLEAQVKLLRILQEKEIRRVGGKSPLKVNVRIIAATNRNLEELVAEGRFRLDLYYRLNVFPIQLPPLRERKEDIPLLALHFIKKYSNLTGKNIEGISDNVMAELMDYHWPGNIRELENLMERSVLTSSGNIIKEIHLAKGIKPKSPVPTAPGTLKTIEENERDYILSVLKQCNGRIWGKGGAASLLNMPPTTLNSRIKKLGIKREFTG